MPIPERQCACGNRITVGGTIYCDDCRKIANFVPAGPWRPMAEAPFEKRVIICDARFACVTEGFQYHKEGWMTYGVGGCYEARPVCWQPMPEPPAGFDANPHA